MDGATREEVRTRWNRRLAALATEDPKEMTKRQEKNMEALELAWGIIANVSGGNWNEQTVDWKKAAERWRDEHWHPALEALGARPDRPLVPIQETVEENHPIDRVWDAVADIAAGGTMVGERDVTPAEGTTGEQRFMIEGIEWRVTVCRMADCR